MVLRHTLIEIKTGPKQICIENGSALAKSAGRLYLVMSFTDACSILLAIDSPHIKAPAEKSSLLNLPRLK